MNQQDAISEIRACAGLAQRRINELHQHEPTNETFTQVGLLDGQDTINDYLSHDEWGIALEHLLYMIHESDVTFEVERVARLHAIAEQFGIHNYYTRSNLTRLGKLATAFNVPPA